MLLGLVKNQRHQALDFQGFDCAGNSNVSPMSCKWLFSLAFWSHLVGLFTTFIHRFTKPVSDQKGTRKGGLTVKMYHLKPVWLCKVSILVDKIKTTFLMSCQCMLLYFPLRWTWFFTLFLLAPSNDKGKQFNHRLRHSFWGLKVHLFSSHFENSS